MTGHVFLSYQHQYKETAVRLRDALKSCGITTWFDEDDMVGSVLDSMAEAVENASVVLMCMSESYKKSENCKKEIEYVERLKKPIIPIRFEAGINPTGWLGISSGSKMVIDFSDPKKFDEKFKQLLKELAAKKIKAAAQSENFAVIVGVKSATATTTRSVVKINLRRSNEISALEQIPTAMGNEAFAAVNGDTVYVTGIGANKDEIWKYAQISGWKKCASLVQGRLRHSAAFIDEVLYICGGFVESTGSVLDSVEAYNVVNDKCSAVGKLVHCVKNSGNCVPFRGSLYIFGGSDKDDNNVSHVQVYNPKQNTCSLLTQPVPHSRCLMRAALLKTSVILLGRYTCFMYNFETQVWHERKQFKTDVHHFGLVLENERVYVIGGGNCETEADGKKTWKCRDDVRYVPLQNIIDDKPTEWKIHARLPRPTCVHGYANIRLQV